MSKPDWIAVDWGTSHLRVYAMSGGSVLDERASDDGMGSLERNQFEGALLALVSDWLGDRTPVLACGMVGARQGWVEAPYSSVPAAVDQVKMVNAPTSDARLDVRVLPGVKQVQPADVMRGEETQIAGFLALNKGWDGVICLPGTHSKWVLVSANEIVSFQTFMTGELFALLSEQSVLRHTVTTANWDESAFSEALSDSMARPEKLAAKLFSIRAESLVNGTAAEVGRARLSGLLIGAELAAARPYWLGQKVAVIGAPEVARLYVAALAEQGVPATHVQGDRMTIAGLNAARLREGISA
ncbi:2-dehydro-3-deoxygalactonokinase [Cognatishimia sp. MH4019]|uniref:2-dehydro-3-deoxygalactonokinase n=1 Tax=Cognatishimia sp. MH4019 TaxID=2854030 RepID=UPI001CD80275|nr:2-dehydro-3-deoxygalactonokinase [Cognatishimia sp. MH4019]